MRRAVLSLTVILATGCGADGPDSSLAEETLEERGRRFYLAYGCGSCHGRDGRGDGPVSLSLDPKPRDFADPSRFIQGASAAEIAETLRLGVRGPKASPMPPYSHLDVDERTAIAAWVASLQRPARLAVEGPWVRAVPSAATTTAAYLEIVNTTDVAVTLTGVASDGSQSAEFHETVHTNGVASMRRLERVTIPPRERVAFSQAGRHVMLIGVRHPLPETVALTFAVDGGQDVTVRAPVGREAPE